MSEAKAMGERLASLEEFREQHEQRCDDRQRAMGREIGELKTSVHGLTKGAWGVVIALLAWALLQVYGKLEAMREPLPTPPPASSPR